MARGHANNKEILRCDGIEKVFGKGDNQVTALNGISLSIEKGDFVAIIGASGSGKSTLFHILSSVDKPTKGTVTIDGVDLSGLNATDAAIFRRRKVGLVYQFYNLIPTLTAEKNILMPMLLDKRKPDLEYFKSIVKTLGIEDKLESLPSQLSGGQQFFHCIQCLFPALCFQNAFQSHYTTSPHPRNYRIGITTVQGSSFPKRRTSCQSYPVAQYSLALWDNLTG